MRALYWKRPTAAQVGDIGLKPEDFDSDEPKADLWPDNEAPVELFLLYQTQWRAGSVGIFALDYNVLFHHLDRHGIAGDEFDYLMEGIRTIEDAALRQMSKS